MRTSGEIDFRFRLNLKITLVESTYPSQRPQCPSLSPHFLLTIPKHTKKASSKMRVCRDPPPPTPRRCVGFTPSKIGLGVCGPLPETLTLVMTKIYDILTGLKIRYLF